MMSKSDDAKTGICEVCQQPSETKCSGCKLVFYCNEVHQQEHWKEHKNICKPFQVTSDPELGRFLLATRDLQRGDQIFSEEPLVFGPKQHQISDGPFPCVGCCSNLVTRVANIFMKDPLIVPFLILYLNITKRHRRTMKWTKRLLYNHECDRCPGCFWPICNLNCEGLKKTTRHGFECNVLKLRPPSLSESFYDYYRFDILIILRALYLQKRNNEKWKKMLQLQDHLDLRGPNSEIFKIIDEKAHFLKEKYLVPLEQYEKESGSVVLQENSIEIIHKIYGILDVNATELTENIDAIILYHIGSLLEHNCTPNTMQTIDEKTNFRVTFRSASPIQKGEHITSIYTHILWGTSARRVHLKKSKYFSCNCKRCQDPTEFGTYLSALKCLGGEKSLCGGMQLPVNPCEENCYWMCDRCKIKLPDGDVMKFVDHLNELVDKILARKTNIEELEDMLKKLLNFLNQGHYLVYFIKHSLLQLYGNVGNIEASVTVLHDKLKMCQDLKKITKTIDPGNARLSLYLGVLLNEEVICRFKLIQRMFDESNKLTLIDQMKNISDLCDENKEVLRYESHSPAGGKLLGEVKKNEIRFKNWLEEYDIHY